MRLGTDIIEIDRIIKAYQKNTNIAQKILSDQEFMYFKAHSHAQKMTFLAGRFCAKEAYSKALGTGFSGPLKMEAISIMNNQHGAPILLQGPVVEGVKISISHSQTIVMATCLIEKSDREIEDILREKGFNI